MQDDQLLTIKIHYDNDHIDLLKCIILYNVNNNHAATKIHVTTSIQLLWWFLGTLWSWQETEYSNWNQIRNALRGEFRTVLQSKPVGHDVSRRTEYTEVVSNVCSLNERPSSKESIFFMSQQSTLRNDWCAGKDGFQVEKHSSQSNSHDDQHSEVYRPAGCHQRSQLQKCWKE